MTETDDHRRLQVHLFKLLVWEEAKAKLRTMVNLETAKVCGEGCRFLLHAKVEEFIEQMENDDFIS